MIHAALLGLHNLIYHVVYSYIRTLGTRQHHIVLNAHTLLQNRYAVDKGYWSDEFIQFFCRSSIERKSPEISRGYYARVKSVRSLVEQFVAVTGGHCQLVSLGAGFDTLFWQLLAVSLLPRVFCEVDFSTVTSKKCQAIKTKKPLLEALGEQVVVSQSELHSASYHLLSGDLRDMHALGRRLLEAGIDTSVPTMFLAECVLVYLEPDKSREVIRWAGNTFSSAFFINYEPINPHDRFGKVMQANLSSRKCSLLGIDACPDLESQKKRYLDNGWSDAWALDMQEVYTSLPQEDVRRMERLEFLDEIELLTQLLQHYCLSCAFNDTLSLGLSAITLTHHPPTVTTLTRH